MDAPDAPSDKALGSLYSADFNPHFLSDVSSLPLHSLPHPSSPAYYSVVPPSFSFFSHCPHPRPPPTSQNPSSPSQISMPKNQVLFECNMQMNEHDVRNYLQQIYDVPVHHVRLTLNKGEARIHGSGKWPQFFNPTPFLAVRPSVTSFLGNKAKII